jgi:4-hydroxy-2-oxoglutarate aldolase
MPPHNDQSDELSSTGSSTPPPSSLTTYRYLGTYASNPRPLLPGIYTPTPTFFNSATQNLDLPTLQSHILRLCASGITGIVTQGSNGEACHLSHSERRLITATARATLDASAYSHIPVLVGCGAQSTQETIELCHDALISGGDYALVLPPSYYKPLYTRDCIRDFFLQVADESPVPILIYNFPGAASGLDLDSEMIEELSRHENIVGAKLTCGNTGKLARVKAGSHGFLTMSGSCDFTLQALVVGGDGVIGGLSNIAPRACVEIYRLFNAGRFDLARKMQAIVARGDWVCIKGGVVATKAGLMAYFKYGGYGRKPLPRPEEAKEKEIKDELAELMLLEEFLVGGGKEVHFERLKEFPQLVELERGIVTSSNA